MNRIYRLVWNRTLGVLQVACELARSRTRSGRSAAGGRAAGARGRVSGLAWLAGIPLGLPLAVLAAPMAAVSTAPVGTETVSITAVSSGTLPTGGTVTAGRGQIVQGGNTLTVTQQSQNLSLNWQTFNIGADGTVNFLQPNAQAIAVNRISDANGSVILGHLNANGQVFLINPNGVLFGQGAQVNVGSLVASTLDVSDSELGSGTLHFSGAGNGRVVNRGTLNADGGYVALLGAQVSNAGTISANGGSVVLAGGTAVALSFDHNRMISLQVDKSTLDALAENRQLIVADGGQVLMSAGAKDSLLASVVNNSGTIQARTVENRGGRIVLLGGMAAGTTTVAGTLDASAQGAGDGGFIETSAAHVHVADGAKVTTQSTAGKTGTWLIDPQDFTIGAGNGGTITGGTPSGDISGATLDAALGSGNVTILSSQGSAAGSGNIYVNDAVSWGANTLTLTAAHDIDINAVMTASGSAGLVLNTATSNGADTGVAGGTVNVMPGQGGRVDFTGSSNTLSINSQSYTIITALGAPGSTTGTDLQGINGGLGGHYALGANIDASGTANWNTNTGFTPIGNSSNAFTGIFDGLGHTISGLTINRPSASDIGLFGYTNTGSTIRNLGLLGGSVTGSSNVGGLVGYNSNGTISQVYATGAVSGIGNLGSNSNVGGLVGYNTNGTISQAYATGAVSGGSNVGGLLGYSFNGTISQAYATGAVNGSSHIGGLAGANYNGTISQVHATGAVSGGADVGGLVGYNFNAGTISQAYATGAVSGTSNVGGLVGYNYSDTISQAYATGAVSGTGNVGGLVGSTSSGTISQAYATGAVSGSGGLGGLVGYNTNAAITNSYWDTETTGQAASAGGGTGLTTSALIAALPGGFATSAWGNGDNQTTPYLLGMAGNPVFNVNDLPSGTISSTHRPKLYSAILDVDQLQGVNAGRAGRYVLGNNIDASGTASWNSGAGFAPIGDSTTPFTGIFDGLGHTISGLTINRAGTSYVGLIGYMGNNSTIRNLGLLGGSVRGKNWVGGLVGRNNFGTISRVYATGAVSGGTGVGGLVGDNKGTISQAHATGKVSGSSDSGGLVGSSSGTITRAYATGAVSGDVSAGGLVGSAQNGTISQVYATGAVDGIVHIGGLVGSNSSNSISQAYATGAVNGASSSVGGLVGSDSRGTISQTYATGAVSGASSVGGLVGDTYFSVITASYWDTATTGQASSAAGTGLTTSALIAALPGGFATSAWGNGDNQTTPYLLGMAGNQVFNVNDLPSGTISSTNRPNLYTAILDVDQLQGVNAGLTGRYVLGNNIDASATASWNSGAGFAPIGDNTTPFTGIFDGLGHRISGLVINRPTTNHVGLFGDASTYSVIRNVGLVGGSVVGASYVGGLVGDNDSGTISQVYATGVVSGGYYVGALVGLNSLNGTISQAYATGAVSGTYGVGGLVGSNNSGTISQAHATGAVSGTYYVGGLVGYNDSGTISQAYATGAVSGASGVGGLAGINYNSTISQAYATGTVSGTASGAGGLVGANSASTISQAYATGAVSGISNVGGLVGNQNSGTISQSYASGAVSGNSKAGGLVGDYLRGTITASYWDAATTGQATSSGSTNNSGLTTTALIATLPTGFDPASWGNGDNQATPYLLGMAGNQVFNVNDLPSGTISSTNRPNLYTAILDVNQLQVVNADLTGRYVLGNNIDASATVGWNGGAGFTPIGSYASAFSGTLDGLGYAINNLTINLTANGNRIAVGLVGRLAAGGQIRNLRLQGGSFAVSMTGTGSSNYLYAGGLVGYNSGTIDHSYSTVSLTTSASGSALHNYIGGLVGANVGASSNARASITNSYASGSINSQASAPDALWNDIGGLVGNAVYSSVSTSYASGDVGSQANSSNALWNEVGGLVGSGTYGSVSDSYATGSISSQASSTGGSFWNYVGGLIGGNLSGTVSTSYATGFIGSMTAGTTYNYIGGLVGTNTASTITTSYWDTVTTGQATSTGGGTGLTTQQMMDPASFLWGSNISATGGSSAAWRIYAGDTAPLLRAFMTDLAVTATDVTATYNASAYAGSGAFTYGALTPSYWLPSSSVDGALILGAANTGTPAINAGSYTLDHSPYSSQLGYDINYTAGALTIDKAALTIGTSAVGKTYDGGLSAAGTAIVTGGTLFGSDSLSGGSFAFTDKNVGTGKTVTVAGVTVNDGNSGNNYLVSYASNTTSSISALGITVNATGSNRVYDGTTADAVSLASTGILAGDTVSFSGTSSFADKNVGTGKAVSVSGISASGTDAGNYSFNSTASTTADITQAALTIGTSDVGKTYDGGLSAAGTALVTGGTLFGSDSLSGGSFAFTDKNVGTGKTVTVAGVTVNDGNSGNNYLVSYASNTTSSISALGITVNATGSNRVYDGTTADAVSLASTGILAGDTVSFSGTGSFADKNVGSGKTVSVSGIGASGTDAGNYRFNTTASTTADISALAITVNATGSNRIYDGTTADAVTLASSGILAGDTVSFSGTGSFADKNVGSAKAVGVSGISASGTDAGNYSFNAAASATADITPATLTYLATPASFFVGQTPTGLTGEVQGLVGGDTLADATTGTLAWITPATSASLAGQYAIDGSGLTAGNYLLVQALQNATALQVNIGAAPALVTAVIADLQQSGTSNGHEPANLQQSNASDRRGIADLPQRKARHRHDLMTPDIRVVGGGVRLP